MALPRMVGSPPRAAASRSAARLEGLVGAHYDFVWRSLRRLGVGAADAEDAAQEVLMTAARRLADIRPEAERAFLFRTAMNVAAHAHRSRLRRREVQGDKLPDQVDPSPSPEELTDAKRAREAFDRILDRLAVDLRAVFVLFEVEQLTMGEIAELLELAPGTVASRLRRAREQFLEHARRIAARGELKGEP